MKHSTKKGHGLSQESIRRVLREHPDGLTAAALAIECGISQQAVCNALINMEDVYVDRWTPNPSITGWSRVICVIPEDAPMPDMTPSQWLKSIEARKSAEVR